jgi:glycosyltransferase involved in cell wall biosynthesis
MVTDKIRKVIIGGMSIFFWSCSSQVDLTIVGPTSMVHGFGNQTISLIACLQDMASVSYVCSRFFLTGEYRNAALASDISYDTRTILDAHTFSYSKVVLFTDVLTLHGRHLYVTMPPGYIKIAYSMVETTAVPVEWVDILNTHFDAVIVPDQWLVSVYKNAGVQIPIFVIPPCINIEELLDKPINNNIFFKKHFVFGVSATLCERKNIELLVESFYDEFAHDSTVALRIHSHIGHALFERLSAFIKNKACSNIELLFKEFAKEDYYSFLQHLDCYVLLSKGEGFSITPRQALACAIPSILTNNTGHTSLCEQNFVYSIECMPEQPSDYRGAHKGYWFSCSKDDVKKALRSVYEHYAMYKERALAAREWLKLYVNNELKKKYYALINPQFIILSDDDRIEDGCIVTSSAKLYAKYLRVKEMGREDSEASCYSTKLCNNVC